jgi:hypothetical protein
MAAKRTNSAPRVDAEPLFAPERDHGHPHETDGNAGPAPGSEALSEKADGQERGEERDGGDDQARHPRPGGELPVVERHVVEREGEQAREHRRGNVPDLGQTHAGERGVDGERHRGHEHAQQGQGTGQVRVEGISNGGVGRGAEYDGCNDSP